MISNLSMICGKCGFYRHRIFLELLFDEVTLGIIVAQYGSIWGVDPSFIRNGGGISHRVLC